VRAFKFALTEPNEALIQKRAIIELEVPTGEKGMMEKELV
jgi:hypothetical protein